MTYSRHACNLWGRKQHFIGKKISYCFILAHDVGDNLQFTILMHSAVATCLIQIVILETLLVTVFAGALICSEEFSN
jgi:hypothetical protein